jgi:threonine/homoserine/homoserine lactone efflux protein
MTLLGLDQSLGFLLAAMLVTVAPGPDNLMVLSLGMSRGRRHGMAFGLGCAAGCLSHTLLAALGVSALIAASPLAFTGLKILGGVYLVWLGVQAIRFAARLQTPQTGEHEAQEAKVRPYFIKGMAANAINPKVIVFFLAFLPQFVDPASGGTGGQMAQLGLIFTLQSGIIFGAIGYFAGHVGSRISRTPGIGLWLDRAAGGVFILIGAKLIASR